MSFGLLPFTTAPGALEANSAPLLPNGKSHCVTFFVGKVGRGCG